MHAGVAACGSVTLAPRSLSVGDALEPAATVKIAAKSPTQTFSVRVVMERGHARSTPPRAREMSRVYVGNLPQRVKLPRRSSCAWLALPMHPLASNPRE